MKNKSKQHGKSGYALVVVLFFMAAISTFLTMLSLSASQRVHTVKKLTSQMKAKAMAEAGCEYGYAILSADWESRFDPDAFEDDYGINPTASVTPVFTGEGYEISYANAEQTASYDIDVTAVGTNSAMITTTGTCGSVTAVSVVTMQDIGGSNDDGSVLDGEAFEYAILCGGSFHFRGCSSLISPSGNAKFHSNGALDNFGDTAALINLSSSVEISSGLVTFGGDITAPLISLHPAANVSGTETETDVPTVEIPDIDLTPYYGWALSKSEVRDGPVTISSSYTPDGGILWVNGNVTISGGPGTTFSGSIMATGNITISGSADVTPTDCAFALASRDGNIVMSSAGRITGLIYAKAGGLQHTSTGEIVGQIIVNGDINKAGNSDIMTSFASDVPSPPGGSTTTDFIAITAWQE